MALLTPNTSLLIYHKFSGCCYKCRPGFIDEEFLTPQKICTLSLKSSAWVFGSEYHNCPRCNPPYLTWQPPCHSLSPQTAGLALGNVYWQGVRLWYRSDLAEMFKWSQRRELQVGGPLMEEEAATISREPPNRFPDPLNLSGCLKQNSPNVPLADQDASMVNTLG